MLYINDMPLTYYERKSDGGHELIDAVKEQQSADLKERHERIARRMTPEQYEMFTTILFEDEDLREAVGDENLTGMRSIVDLYEKIPVELRRKNK